ncbi:streptavidin-V2-like [Rhopilema esculentum]|uniref:streptavidin-V2-like n=1 Tax=Rhopilema esculentum TaxID=499914 RepID=UPI0031DB3DB8|eukprot:gene1512-15956_t
MKTIIILSTLYCLCSGMFVQAQKPGDAECCPLSGTWVSERGVTVELEHNADGTLTGTYLDLSEASPDSKTQPLHGQAGKGKPSTFGFVVSMKDGSTKVWTGQYQFCKGEATLLSRWMMTSVTTTCANDWKGHFNGEDRFVRKTSSKHSSKLGHYIRRMFKKIIRNQQSLKH